MQNSKSAYLPFEQILAYCEGSLTEAKAAQIRTMAAQEPWIQETIVHLQDLLREDSSQNIKHMLDHSLQQFLQQPLVIAAPAAKDLSWMQRISINIRDILSEQATLWRPILILGTIVLLIMLGELVYQSLVVPEEAKGPAVRANGPALLPPDDLGVDATGQNEVLNPTTIQKSDNLVLPGGTKEIALTAGDSSLLLPDDLSAEVAENNAALNPTAVQNNESLMFPAETTDTRLTANEANLSQADELTAQAAGNDEVLTAPLIQKDESLFFQMEANERAQTAGDSTLLFPGGFSPNGDGNNDVFKPKLLRKIKVFHEFSIYNRWGEQVYTAVNFSPKSRKKEWDGIFQGEPAEEGTYVFVVRLKNALGFEETITGDFVLMR
ncbi:MAG: gliding motility-associated C-terminal domain-containing protein [Saprospiraceae bacterium]|nr:gliding motility-associated C-terminal domain-containing protein [Saprospiraceae bacterium]